MKQYYDLVQEIRQDGIQTPNRTGIDAISIDGAMMKFRMKDGFPMLGGRFTPFKSMIGELCGFYQAATSAAKFCELGCKVWDKNANDPGVENSNAWLRNPNRKGEDDLGPIYGEQWRNWPGYKLFDVPVLGDPAEVKARYRAIVEQLRLDGWEEVDQIPGSFTLDSSQKPKNIKPTQILFHKKIDQLGDAIRTVIKNPNSRRILFHGWNPAVLDEVALPACHLLYQLMPNERSRIMNMCVYIRSNDIGKGAPYNISQASAQLHLISHMTGYTPGTLTYFVADAHVYIDQIEWLDEQLELWDSGQRFELPTLTIADNIPRWDNSYIEQFGDIDTALDHLVEWLGKITPNDFLLEGYQYHTLKTPAPPMAV